MANQPCPPFSIFLLQNAKNQDINSNTATYFIIKCHTTKFQIGLNSLQDLQHTDNLIKYNDLSTNPTAKDELAHWMITPCRSKIQELVPKIPENATVQEYMYPPTTYIIALKDDEEGNLMIKELYLHDKASLQFAPGLIPPLPNFPIARFNASETRFILPRHRPQGKNIYTPPIKVLTATGQIATFKAMTEAQVLKEITLRTQIRACNFEEDTLPYLSDFIGIVQSQDGSTLLGGLYDYPHGVHCYLSDPAFKKYPNIQIARSELVEVVIKCARHGILLQCLRGDNIFVADNDMLCIDQLGIDTYAPGQEANWESEWARVGEILREYLYDVY